jgi:hypothetical protein
MPPALLTSPSSRPKCLAAALADLGSELFRCGLALVVVQPDLCPLLGVSTRQSRADAGGGAGDEHRLAGEVRDDKVGQVGWHVCSSGFSVNPS